MNEGGDSHVPGGVSGHSEAEKRPNPVIVKRRYENSGGATCSENVCPCSFVQVVINVINITVLTKNIFKLFQLNFHFF